MKKKVLELGKSLLIVLLMISLLLLTFAAMPAEMVRSTPWLSTLLQPFAPLLGLPQAELTYVAQARPVSDAAQPLLITVNNTSGRYTAQWDFETLDTSYETLGGMLGEALDTAGEFTEISAQQLQKAVRGQSVCFDYRFDLDAGVLASWLDASCDQQPPQASLYILALENEQVRLYLSGKECCRADTQVSADALRKLLMQFQPDGSQFAFETDSGLAALTILPAHAPVVTAGSVFSPCDNRYIETLATELGFNPYDETRYTDSNGVTYFSETNCSLQISADGSIVLTSAAEDRFRATGDTTALLVEQARSMVSLAVDHVIGDGRLYLSGVTRDQEQTTCTFDYVVNGIALLNGNEPAASVTFAGQSVVQMQLQATGFSLTDETLKVMPPAQAMAILPAGGRLELAYQRGSSGNLSAGWKK